MMSLDNCFMRTKYLFFITVLWSLFSITAWGQSALAQGEKAYTEQNYVAAVDFFKKAVQEAPTAENYYNWGNANYRLKKYPEAVIAYLRCLRIDPSNETYATEDCSWYNDFRESAVGKSVYFVTQSRECKEVDCIFFSLSLTSFCWLDSF